MGKKIWRLHDHQSPNGRRDVRKYYERASDAVQAALDVRWEYLETRSKELWDRPEVAKLSPESKGATRDLYEFRLFADRTQHRPLGYFGPGVDEFTLLFWAIEKDRKFQPRSATSTAEDRMKAIKNRCADSVPWDENEDFNETRQATEIASKGVQIGVRKVTS